MPGSDADFAGSDGNERFSDKPSGRVSVSGSFDGSLDESFESSRVVARPSARWSARRSARRGRRAEFPTEPAQSTGEGTPPSTVRDAWAWLALAALGFVGGQVVSYLLLVVVAAANGQLARLQQLTTEVVPPSWVVVTGLIGLWIGFVAACVIASRTRGSGDIRHDLGLEIRPRDIVIGPVIGVLGQLVLLKLLYLPLEHVVSHLDQKLSQPAKHLTGGFPGADLAVIAVLTVVFVPVVEETFFRGLVLRSLLRIFRGAGPVVGTTLAVVSSGILFGLAHFEALQLLGLASFGVVLSVMAYKFGRLGPSIFAHATFNLLAVLSVAFPTGLAR